MNKEQMLNSIYNRNIDLLKSVKNENIKYIYMEEFTDEQKKSALILNKSLFDLYESVNFHFNNGLNQTSMNVVFRSFFETYINILYLYKLDSNPSFSKKLKIYSYCEALSRKKILSIAIPNSPSGEAMGEILNRKHNNKELGIDVNSNVEKLSEFINLETFNEIREEGQRLRRKRVYSWYNFLSGFEDDKGLRGVCKYVDKEELYLLLYSYLSSDAHGMKLFSGFEKAEDMMLDSLVDHNFIYFFANQMVAEVIESMNKFNDSVGYQTASIDEITDDLMKAREMILLSPINTSQLVDKSDKPTL